MTVADINGQSAPDSFLLILSYYATNNLESLLPKKRQNDF